MQSLGEAMQSLGEAMQALGEAVQPLNEAVHSRQSAFADFTCLLQLYCYYLEKGLPKKEEMETIQTRQDLREFMQAQMAGTYKRLSEDQKLDLGQNMVKTYLIEGHTPENSSHDIVFDILRNASKQKPENLRITPSETKEEKLFKIECVRQFKSEKRKVYFYLEASNSRFWKLTTAGNTEDVKWITMNWIKSSPLLDSIWLSVEKMEEIAENPAVMFRQMSLDYDQRIWNNELMASGYDVEYLKMQLSSGMSKDVLELLRTSDKFKSAIDLSTVTVKYKIPLTDEFSKDRIKYYGRITTIGSSFDAHNILINEIVLKPYVSAVRKLEKDFALHMDESCKTGVIEGEPIEIEFERKINSLEPFVEKVFNGTEPFRLIGLPMRIMNGYYRVRATDLHMETRVDFEIMPDLIRIYLFPSSCGNSVMRFFTNFQRHWDSTASFVKWGKVDG